MGREIARKRRDGRRYARFRVGAEHGNIAPDLPVESRRCFGRAGREYARKTDLIIRSFALVLAFLVGGLPAFAQETSACWYPESAQIGCSTQKPTNSAGILHKGIHAIFGAPTRRYGHNVLGGTPEWGRIDFVVQGSITDGPSFSAALELPLDRVFEDTAPRFADIDGDGAPEIIVVESQEDKGARLSVYKADTATGQIKLLAATQYIGTRFRWLAPIGVADFNGDGAMDIAYIDRPHLAKTSRIVIYDGTRDLKEIATLRGFTNHRIGEDFISGGVRNCDGTPEMITADASWSKVMSSRFVNGKLTSKAIARYKGKASFTSALTCEF